MGHVFVQWSGCQLVGPVAVYCYGFLCYGIGGSGPRQIDALK